MGDYDPKLIFVQAERFLFADEKLRGPGLDIANAAYVMLPCLVMQALSIELYLKCLISLETGKKPPRGHHLKHLFDRLNVNTQKHLAALWRADTEGLNNVRNMLPEEMREAISDDVAKALTDGARAFEELRYHYETELTCRFYIDRMPRMLRSVIWQRMPEWYGLGPAIPIQTSA